METESNIRRIPGGPVGPTMLLTTVSIIKMGSENLCYKNLDVAQLLLDASQ